MGLTCYTCFQMAGSMQCSGAPKLCIYLVYAQVHLHHMYKAQCFCILGGQDLQYRIWPKFACGLEHIGPVWTYLCPLGHLMCHGHWEGSTLCKWFHNHATSILTCYKLCIALHRQAKDFEHWQQVHKVSSMLTGQIDVWSIDFWCLIATLQVYRPVTSFA